MARVRLDGAGRTAWLGDMDLGRLDALVVKKLGREYGPEMLDRLEILSFLAGRGVRVFSPPESMMRLLDRLSCTVELLRAGIPMPPTVATEDVEAAVAAVRDFGEAVVKPLYSTKARGMELVRADDPDLAAVLRRFRDRVHPMLYVQKRLDMPDRDLGIAFLAGEYLGAYARVRGEGWSTSTAQGGRYASHEPSPEVVELARRAQAPFGLDFTSVDVVETGEGPLVFEVSAFGGFRGLQEGAGLDAAQAYARHVLARLGAA
jgi:ribosomal protein S6--L-glutamate ligase